MYKNYPSKEGRFNPWDLCRGNSGLQSAESRVEVKRG